MSSTATEAVVLSRGRTAEMCARWSRGESNVPIGEGRAEARSGEGDSGCGGGGGGGTQVEAADHARLHRIDIFDGVGRVCPVDNVLRAVERMLCRGRLAVLQRRYGEMPGRCWGDTGKMQLSHTCSGSRQNRFAESMRATAPTSCSASLGTH